MDETNPAVPAPEAKKPFTRLTSSQKVTVFILIAAILLISAPFAFYMLKNSHQKGTILKDENVFQLPTTPSEPVAGPVDEPAGLAEDGSEEAAAAGTAADSVLEPEVAADPVGDVEIKEADLYIKKYRFSEDPETGTEFTAKIDIGNKGNADAKDFHWEWWPASSAAACDKKIDKLAVGDVKTVECDYTYGGWANYATKAVVDSENDVEESDENNNVATKQVIPIHETQEAAKPDIYISEYKFDHNPVKGQPFTVSITVYNQGDAPSGSFSWEWWSSSAVKVCDGEIDSLSAHGGKVVKCTHTYGGWANYPTKAVADSGNDIDESDESNNTYTRSVIPIH